MTPVGSEMAALSEMRRVNSLFLSLSLLVFHSMYFHLSSICRISSVRISNPKRLVDETVVIHNTSREPLTSQSQPEYLTKQSSVPFHPRFNAADVLCCYSLAKIRQ